MDNFVNRDLIVETIKNTEVRVSGMRFGKNVAITYGEKLRDALVEAVEKVPCADDVDKIRHATWITVGKTEAGSIIRMCSDCLVERKGRAKTPWCPYCGAKMDVKE